MKLLDEYFEIEKKILAYFDYKASWHVFPLEDAREYYWCIVRGHEVYFADSEEELKEQVGCCYSNAILREQIFRKDDFTLICVDTQSDGNKFLQIFDNSKERPALSAHLEDY